MAECTSEITLRLSAVELEALYCFMGNMAKDDWVRILNEDSTYIDAIERVFDAISYGRCGN